MNKPTIHACRSMAEVRSHIDALDSRIVPLLAERSGYVAQAARIKQHADQVHDQDRIDFIVSRVKAMARGLDAPEAVVEATYRALIAASIEFERGEFARIRQEA
jgi:isochorismate pyruvate lyase